MRKLPEGDLQVYENARHRWLCIDETVQTAMSLANPNTLVLPHLHGLAMFFYLKSQWHSILELGLGGGAMSRFVAAFHPDCRLTSVELSEPIIDVYQQHFSTTNPNHQIICGDANDYIMNNKVRHDGVIVDLFSGNQSPDFLLDPNFYRQLWKSVNEDGVVAINVIAHGQVHFDAVLDCVMDTMSFLPLCFSVPGYKNKILLLSKQSIKPFDYDPGLVGFAQHHQLDLNQIMPLNLRRYR